MFAKKTTLIPLLLKKRFVFLGLALLPQFASADDFCTGIKHFCEGRDESRSI